MRKTRIQLQDQVTGKVIQASGGMAMICVNGEAAQVSLLDSTGAAATNPTALTNGLIEFYVADSVTIFDMYIMCPGGQFLEVAGVVPGGPNEFNVDLSRRNQIARIPYSSDDSTAATEKDTGMELPTDCMVHADGLGIYVEAIDATETMDVGILSTEANGDANGFLAAIDIGTLGAVSGEVGFDVGTNNVIIDLTGGDAEFTYGALMCAAGTIDAKAEGTDVDTEAGGLHILKDYRVDGTAVTVSYTQTAGSTTGDGYILIPYTLYA
jgi:hypothetical protein